MAIHPARSDALTHAKQSRRPWRIAGSAAGTINLLQKNIHLYALSSGKRNIHDYVPHLGHFMHLSGRRQKGPRHDAPTEPPAALSLAKHALRGGHPIPERSSRLPNAAFKHRVWGTMLV
jgi:hypothetical protein